MFWPFAIDSAMFEYAGILLSLFFFALSSIYDFRTREVDDWVWIVYGSIGLIVTVARLVIDSSMLFLTIASVVITVVVALGLFYFGLFGGADAKAIICLGVSVPLTPSAFHPLLGYVHPFFPLVVVILGFICSASLAIWFGLRNAVAYLTEKSQMFEGLEHESRWKKAMALITGYRTELSKLESIFYLYPMEDVLQEPESVRRAFKLFVDAESDREMMVTKLKESLPKLGYSGKVWVTPGLPMLFFILIGLIVSLVFGDVIFAIIFSLAAR